MKNSKSSGVRHFLVNLVLFFLNTTCYSTAPIIRPKRAVAGSDYRISRMIRNVQTAMLENVDRDRKRNLKVG